MLHVRIDADTKTLATEALAAMGLSVSEAVRLFLRRVVIDQGLPLEMKVLNLSTVDLAPICQRHGIYRLSAFGSRTKGTARPDSDLDLLVEFESGQVPGLIGLSAIEIELTEALGVKVDLRTAQELSPYFREDVLRQAQVVYAAP